MSQQYLLNLNWRNFRVPTNNEILAAIDEPEIAFLSEL